MQEIETHAGKINASKDFEVNVQVPTTIKRDVKTLFQYEDVLHSLFELGKGQLLVSVFVDELENLDQLVLEGNVGERDGDQQELSECYETSQGPCYHVQSVKKFVKLLPVDFHIVFGEEGHHGLDELLLVDHSPLLLDVGDGLLHLFLGQRRVRIHDVEVLVVEEHFSHRTNRNLGCESRRCPQCCSVGNR